jgi:dTDP-4-dehydrorhamnose reductase
MSILVNGANGQLGLDVVRELTRRGKPVIGMDHTTMDVTDPNSVNAAFDRCRPETVIHCAAWTNVESGGGYTDRRLLQVYERTLREAKGFTFHRTCFSWAG